MICSCVFGVLLVLCARLVNIRASELSDHGVLSVVVLEFEDKSSGNNCF